VGGGGGGCVVLTGRKEGKGPPSFLRGGKREFALELNSNHLLFLYYAERKKKRGDSAALSLVAVLQEGKRGREGEVRSQGWGMSGLQRKEANGLAPSTGQEGGGRERRVSVSTHPAGKENARSVRLAGMKGRRTQSSSGFGPEKKKEERGSGIIYTIPKGEKDVDGFLIRGGKLSSTEGRRERRRAG